MNKLQRQFLLFTTSPPKINNLGSLLNFYKISFWWSRSQEPVSQNRKHKLKFKATKWTTVVQRPQVMHVSILFFIGKERRVGGGRGKVGMQCHIFMKTICEISFTEIGTWITIYIIKLKIKFLKDCFN